MLVERVFDFTFTFLKMNTYLAMKSSRMRTTWTFRAGRINMEVPSTLYVLFHFLRPRVEFSSLRSFRSFENNVLALIGSRIETSTVLESSKNCVSPFST